MELGRANAPHDGELSNQQIRRLFPRRPGPVGRRQGQSFTKMGNRGLSEILELSKISSAVSRTSPTVSARGRQHVSYACGKSNVFDQGIVRQFRRRSDETSFAHFFAFSSSSTRLSL